MSLNKSWLTITLPCVDNFFLQIFFKIFSLIVKQHAVRKPRFSRVRKRGKMLPIAFKSHKMVGVLGFEPRTSSLSGTRSNQLSYTPDSPKNPVPSVTDLGKTCGFKPHFPGTPRSGIPCGASRRTRTSASIHCHVNQTKNFFGLWFSSGPFQGFGAEGARTLNILLAKQVL